MANTCYGCNRDLGNPKRRFEWLVSRGYSVKDAAASVLHNPTSTIPVKQCCIVGLQTNIDPDKDLIERQAIKEEIEEIRALELENRGLPPKIQEEVKIFVSNENGSAPGKFVLRDADFEDPTLMAPSFADKSRGIEAKGFEITDISKVPDDVVNKEGWRNNIPLALWSGNIKLVPVIQVGNSIIPGVIWIQSTAGDKPMTIIDKSLIGGEIIDYSIENIPLQQGINPSTGQPIKIEAPLHVIRVRKKFPEDIIA